MITAVTSWRGIGATTTALLLAVELAEQHDAWLIEADPAGGVLAGRVDLAPHELAGLERISFGPDGGTAEDLFDAVAHAHGPLRLVAAPVDAFRAHACHSPRVPWPELLRDLEGDVVVDIGRIRAGGTAAGLLARVDTIVLATTPEVSTAVASTEWLRSRGRVAPGERGIGDVPVRVAVVDAPGGVAFPERALRADLAVEWGAWLSWEPDTVDLIHAGVGAQDRRLRRSALLNDVRALAEALRGSLVVTR